MPAFNSASTISASIESVLSQKYIKWELVVVDDCSIDGTDSVVSKYLSDSRISYYFNSDNIGPAGARNIGLKEARGEYIAFLDSDDYWYPLKLETQIQYMLKNDVDISYCLYERVDSSGCILEVVKPKAVVKYRDLLCRNHIGLSTAVYRRTCADHHIFELTKHEDYVFWVRLVYNVGCACLVSSEKPLVKYLVRNNSVSGNKLNAAIWHWKNLRNDFSMNVLRSSYYFICYCFYQLRRIVFNRNYSGCQ